jgi:hypothetical protein
LVHILSDVISVCIQRSFKVSSRENPVAFTAGENGVFAAVFLG